MIIINIQELIQEGLELQQSEQTLRKFHKFIISHNFTEMRRFD